LKAFFKVEEILRHVHAYATDNFSGILFLGFHPISEGCGRQV